MSTGLSTISASATMAAVRRPGKIHRQARGSNRTCDGYNHHTPSAASTTTSTDTGQADIPCHNSTDIGLIQQDDITFPPVTSVAPDPFQ